jgi:hypothetical protein
MKSLSIQSIPIPSGHSRVFQDDPPDQAAQIQVVVPGYARLPAHVIDEDILLVKEQSSLNPTRRLVVLIPPGEFDETALARRVWQLAASSSFSVLYLALSPDATQSAYQRRRLAGLAAVTSDQNVRAHSSVSAEKNWRKVLEQILTPGDLLVCLAGHFVTKRLFWHRSLGEELVETLDVPVYLFGRFKIGSIPQQRQTIREVLAWVAFILLLAIFFRVQVSIDRTIARPLSTLITSFSVVVEIYLLWKINEWIG